MMMVSPQNRIHRKTALLTEPKMIKLNSLNFTGKHRKHFIGSNSQKYQDKSASKPIKESKLNNLRSNHNYGGIGHDAGFLGPFGWKKYIYVDHTASGKAEKCIEKFIEDEVLPHYANTHTTVSNSSLQTTMFRNEARNIIRQAVGALENDEIIFCGSGATSAVHKLLHSISYPTYRQLIVFVGPFEHHSNILPWREAASKVIEVPMDKKSGKVDTLFLRDNLKKWRTNWLDRRNRLVVGCFSAGSNVTGAVTDDVEITELLHEFGALAFWDYAAAAPHVQINMNPKGKQRFGEGSASKDAIFFSGHKFLGGPQTPGVLVIKKHVLQNPVPHAMGGGTVLFVKRQGHRYYLDNFSDREEGGTPDIVGSIRLGLVFRLRNMVGIENIIDLETKLCRRMLDEWAQIPEIHILGSKDNIRLPCISFMIEHLESGYFMHHSFVVAFLNDLFGIQCRGGCMCAGPYAQTLLGIDDKLASLYETSLKNDEDDLASVIKPGFVRISLSYHCSVEEVDFVIEAVKMIAKNGWKMLPLYKIEKETGSFVFKGGWQPAVASLSLFDNAFPRLLINGTDQPEIFDSAHVLKQAGHFMNSISHSNNSKFVKFPKEPERLKKLRWFMLPSESLFLQCYDHPPNKIESSRPFTPIKMFDDIHSGLGFVDRNSNSCDTVGTSGDPIRGTWRKGSVPYQIYRIWKTRKNEQGKDAIMKMMCTSESDQSRDSSSSGFEDYMKKNR